MKKQLLDLEVVEKQLFNEKYVVLGLTHSESLPEMFPGQFVEVRVDNAPNTFLRRPISIYNVDVDKNILWLFVQIVGEGTQKMSELEIGESANVLLPLGNRFSELDEDVVLIGGGVGIAPLLYYGIELKSKGITPSFVLGGRTKDDLPTIADFEKIGKVYVTTEDASLGERGYVTQHSFLIENKSTIKHIATCGPEPMMKAVAHFAKENTIACEASLENTMACGFGVCLCCVTDTKDGHKCVCTDGPVFDVSTLKW
jgi:dihydroorotate dehydrogenase electron transfer subunit